MSNKFSAARPQPHEPTSTASLVGSWLRDGPGLLSLMSVALVGAGLFAWFLALTDQFLPQDIGWLTMGEAQLRATAGGRLVGFMAHDRAAFGGTLIAVGVLYLWLIRFPLAAGEAWSWWVIAISGSLGFLTFVAYLGTGYLDTWHAVATLALLPLFLLGLAQTRGSLRPDSGMLHAWHARPRARPGSRAWMGRALILLTGFGMLVAGLTIVSIGSLVVFVPQDLQFLGMDHAAMDAMDPRLVPLIAHDRAGFGGGLAITGLTVLGCVGLGRPSRGLWEALLIAGVAGFGAAIGIHVVIGYLDLTHVGPAILGALMFAVGMIVARPTMLAGDA